LRAVSKIRPDDRAGRDGDALRTAAKGVDVLLHVAATFRFHFKGSDGVGDLVSDSLGSTRSAMEAAKIAVVDCRDAGRCPGYGATRRKPVAHRSERALFPSRAEPAEKRQLPDVRAKYRGVDPTSRRRAS